MIDLRLILVCLLLKKQITINLFIQIFHKHRPQKKFALNFTNTEIIKKIQKKK